MPQKSNSTFFPLSKKKLCYIQKVTYHSISKIKVSQVLVLYLIKSRSKNPIISIIIDSGITDHFLSNRDLFSIYTE